MNRNPFLIVAVLAAGLLGAGCNKAGKLSQPSKFTPPAGPMELKLKWPVGERVVQSYSAKMTMEISVPGQPKPINQDVTMGQKYGLTVLKAEPDGGREVEMKFLAIHMIVAQGGRTVLDYDSAKKTEPDRKGREIAAVQKMLQGVVGAKVQCFLDASNNVERVEGVDQLLNRLGTGGPPQATAGIKNMFNADYLKQMLGSSRYFPHKPVQPGDTWPVQMDLPMGELGTLAIDYHYTFERWEKRGPRMCARLEFDGTLKSKSGDNPKSAGMAMQLQNGSSSGVTWFDPELGKAIDSHINQDLTMVMSVPVRVRGKAITQTMTNLMHQDIIMKLESVK